MRGHLFICILAHYLEWLRRKLVPLLCENGERAAAVAQLLPAAKVKGDTERTPEGLRGSAYQDRGQP